MKNKARDKDYYKSGMQIGKTHAELLNKAAVDSISKEYKQTEKARKEYKNDLKELKIKVLIF